MYSMQGSKLVVEPSVDQVVFFYIFSIIMNETKSFEALKLNNFWKLQCNITKIRV